MHIIQPHFTCIYLVHGPFYLSIRFYVHNKGLNYSKPIARHCLPSEKEGIKTRKTQVSRRLQIYECRLSSQMKTFSSSSSTALAISFFCSKTESKYNFGTLDLITEGMKAYQIRTNLSKLL